MAFIAMSEEPDPWTVFDEAWQVLANVPGFQALALFEAEISCAVVERIFQRNEANEPCG